MTAPALQPYPCYRPSGLPWLGDVPAHWDVRRLRNLVDMQASNVDKHSKDQELPVRLCNYVDVYKNDRITADLPFMRATATADEIARFRLQSGDVLITKDSEVWHDIAVPALVEHTADDLVCGYHLALLRPSPDVLSGPYLFRALQSSAIASQFHIAANGVTRYGLPHQAIKSALLPVPPPDEQAAIVRYLDDADGRIRRYTDAKERLIVLLAEQRRAAIHQAVTRGLDPDAPLRPSGVPWLGDVPAHWEVRRLGQTGTFSKGSGGTKDDEVSEGFPCIRYGDIYTSHKYFVQQTRSRISADRALHYARIKYGDVLFASSGETIDEIGKSVVNLIDEEVYCGSDVILFRPSIQTHAKFMGYALDHPGAAYQKACMGRGVTIMHIYASQLKYMAVPFPPLNEQSAIANHIDETTARIDAAIARARRQIDLLNEYRARLIADVVTGQVEVRPAAAIASGPPGV